MSVFVGTFDIAILAHGNEKINIIRSMSAHHVLLSSLSPKFY